MRFLIFQPVWKLWNALEMSYLETWCTSVLRFKVWSIWPPRRTRGSPKSFSNDVHCVKSVSEFFWSVFSRIRTEYGEILCISPYSTGILENTDHKNSEYWHFSRSVSDWYIIKIYGRMILICTHLWKYRFV